MTVSRNPFDASALPERYQITSIPYSRRLSAHKRSSSRDSKSLRNHLPQILNELFLKLFAGIHLVEEMFSLLPVLFAIKIQPIQILLRRRIRYTEPSVSTRVGALGQQRIRLIAFDNPCERIPVAVGVQDAACEAQAANWVVGLYGSVNPAFLAPLLVDVRSTYM